MPPRKTCKVQLKPDPPARSPFGGRSVLVAEDHPAHRRMTRALLEALGHHVTVVVDGFAAVEAAKTTAFDVIVMDRHMPRCGGDQAVVLIRALPGPSRHAIIICHSSDLPVGEAAALYEDALAKPATREAVLGLLERLRGRARFDRADQDVKGPGEGLGSHRPDRAQFN